MKAINGNEKGIIAYPCGDFTVKRRGYLWQ
jgi:hypothetical protein